MANVLATSGTWLGGMFRRHASGQVLYKRGIASVSVASHKGRTELQIDGQIVRLSSEWRDWFIDADELVLPAVGQTLPAEGDRIEETDGSTVYVYEVMPPVPEEPCYEWTSSARRRLRIHTKEVDTR